jgi:Bacterial regulatory protein, Fis family
MTFRPPSFEDSRLFREREATKPRVFGRRLRTPERVVSFQRERLRIVAAELDLLFNSKADGASRFAELSEDGGAVLILGRSIGLSLTVEIDPDNSCYLLCEKDSRNECAFVTDSEERLIDQIVSVVCSLPGNMTLRSLDATMDLLVGRSIEEVERRLILRTLLFFKGDRRQAAFALGLDEVDLRLKLRQYFWSSSAASTLPEAR